MSPPRADLPAPRWLVHLLRTDPAPVPWSRVLRAVVGFTAPIAIGYLAGEPAIGALVSAGVLPTVMGDGSGPYAYRAKRLGITVFAAVFGFALGLVTGTDPWLSHPTVVLVAAVSALVSTGGNNASFAALQLFVFVTLGTGQAEAGTDVAVAVACVVTGGLWGLLLALSGWTVHATSPERQAVAQVYIELAAMHSAQDEATSLAARQQLTTAMNTAYDRLLTARSWLSGRDATYRTLLNLLSATTPAVEASVAMVNAGERAPRDVIAHFTDLAAAVLADAPLPAPPRGGDGGRDDPADPADSTTAALYHALTKINTEEERSRRDRVPWLQKVRDWVESLASGPLTWIAAARLTLCVAIAELVRLTVPLDNPYWLTLTVGLVLKPDFGSVFGRAVLRGVGTVVGVGIGAAILGLGAHGHGPVLIALVAVLAAGLVIGKVRNYGILSAFVTPLIILQMDLTIGGDWGVVLARLTDTVAGCAIVLVFGYLLWPGSRRPRVGGRLADVADTVARYVEVSLGPDADRMERSRCRRQAYRGLADLRTAFQQLVVEPSPAGRQAAAWWPAIVALEQVTDAVTAAVVGLSHGADRPAASDVRLVTAALAELASAVRDQRDPVDVDLPDTEQLAGVADQLDTAFDAVRGPDFTRSKFTFRRRR